jgi:hypothetical protein
MREIVIIFILALASAGALLAQGLSDLFDQKKEQLKYMKLQIAALKVYTHILEEGYTIVKDGNLSIRDIKQGDWDLHQTHFNSLFQVNKAIAADPRVTGSLDLFRGIQDMAIEFSDLQGRWAPLGKQASAALWAEYDRGLRLLHHLIENNSLEMTDDERLEWIGKVYQRAGDLYVKAKSELENIVAMQKQES